MLPQPLLSPAAATAIAAVLNAASYSAMYCVARGSLGHHTTAFAVLIAAIVVLMASAGIFYSMVFGVMMEPTMYGPPEIHLANGLIMTAFALGGVIAGCLSYFAELGLANDLLVIVITQAALAPLIVLGVHLSTRAPSAAAETGSPSTESDPLLTADANEVNAAPQDADGTDEANPSQDDPVGCLAWFRGTLSSWRYYHTILIFMLKVGIGGTFTTNIGSAIAATLPPATSESEINKKISLVVIYLNFAQLLGRLLYTVVLSRYRGNPNVATIVGVSLVGLAYAAIFAVRATFVYTYTNLTILASVFGVVYGIMWCTSGGLLPFAPYSKNVPRVLAVTQSTGGIGVIVLNTITGHFYDQQANADHMCYGSKCYHESDLVMIGISGTLVLVAALRLALGVPKEDGSWPANQQC